MNLETKITIYKFTPQVFTLTLFYVYFAMCQKKNPCKVLIYRDFFVLQFFPAERRALEPLLSQNITQLQIPINNQLITIIIKSKYYRISLAISIFGCIFGCGISNTPSHEHQTKHHFCT